MKMRATCGSCGHDEGRIDTRNGQDCVFCLGCGRHCYNAPRVETGRPVRSLRTRPDIKPGQRARILLRDNATCVICHHADRPLDVGHLISVDEGRSLGMSDAELYHDENLAAMCQTCNSGLSADVVPLRLLASALMARLKNHPGATALGQAKEEAGETA